MATVLKSLILPALRKIGVAESGENLSADEGQDVLDALNSLIENWNTQKLFVYGIAIEEFSLIAGQGSYTLGAGGDFDTTVPITIDKAFLKINEVEYPLSLIDNNEWGAITLKSISSSISRCIYIDRNHPLKTVRIYPVPSQTSILILHNYKQVSSFGSLSEIIAMPMGHKRALIHNLAIEIAPEYGKEASSTVFKIAAESLGNIKRVNLRTPKLKVDPFLVGSVGASGWRIGE